MVIKNGHVIDPKTELDGIYDIELQNGLITKIGNITVEDTDTIDASGFVIAPGLIDVHVHFRDPGFTYKEDIYTGAKAAAKGGFTTVICMANTKPAVDNAETLSNI